MLSPTTFPRHLPSELVEHVVTVLSCCIQHGYGNVEIECSCEGKDLRAIVVKFGKYVKFRVDRHQFSSFSEALVDELSRQKTGN